MLEHLKSIVQGVPWWSNGYESTYQYSIFPGGAEGKESACNAGDPSLILGSGRCPREGTGYPLQYTCLENSIDRVAWWAIVYKWKRVGNK